MEALPDPSLVDGLPVVNPTSFNARGPPHISQLDCGHPKICRPVAMHSVSPKLLESQTTMSAAGMPSSTLEHQKPSMITTRQNPAQAQPHISYVPSAPQDSVDLGTQQLWISPPNTRLGYDDFENYSYVSSSPAVTAAPTHYSKPEYLPAIQQTATKHFEPLPWPPVHPQLQPSLHEHPSFHLAHNDGLRHIPLRVPTMATAPCAERFRAQDYSYQTILPHHFQGQSRPSYPPPEHQSPLPDGLQMTAADGPSPLSPCSSTLKMDPDSVAEERLMSPSCESRELANDEHDSPNPDEDGEAENRVSSVNPADPVEGDGTASTATVVKSEGEPYAKLIYRAFEEHPRHAMTLQELYQWFRDNTDKGKSQGKGWMNSIRHNLSMNQAFTKRDCKSRDDGADNNERADSGIADNKKSTEWCLETWALEQGYPHSTTRYRKGGSSRRGFRRLSASLQAGSHRVSHSRGGGGYYRRRSRCASKKASSTKSRNRNGQAPSRSTLEKQYPDSPVYQPHPALEYEGRQQREPLPPIHHSHSNLDFGDYAYPGPGFLDFASASTLEVSLVSTPLTAPRDAAVEREPGINEPLTPEGSDLCLLLTEPQPVGLLGSAEARDFYLGGERGQGVDLAPYRLPRVAGVYDDKDAMLHQYEWEAEDKARYPQYYL